MFGYFTTVANYLGDSRICCPTSTTSANFMSFFVSGFSYRLTDFDHSDTSTSWNIIKVRSLFEIWRLKVITDLISCLMFRLFFISFWEAV